MPRDRTPSSSSTRRPQQHDNRSITATAQPEHTMLASQPHPTPVSFYGHPAHHRPMGWHSSDPHRPRISPPQPQPMPGRSEPRQTRPRPVSPVSVSVSGQRSAPADRRDHQDHRQAGAMTMTRNDSGGSQGSASSSASASMRGHSFHDHPYTQPRHGPIETPALPSSSVPVTEQGSPPRQRRTRVLMTRLQWNALTALWDQTIFPATAEREALAQEIGLTPRQVQVWFQNQRQKRRREREIDENSAMMGTTVPQTAQAPSNWASTSGEVSPTTSTSWIGTWPPQNVPTRPPPVTPHTPHHRSHTYANSPPMTHPSPHQPHGYFPEPSRYPPPPPPPRAHAHAHARPRVQDSHPPSLPHYPPHAPPPPPPHFPPAPGPDTHAHGYPPHEWGPGPSRSAYHSPTEAHHPINVRPRSSDSSRPHRSRSMSAAMSHRPYPDPHHPSSRRSPLSTAADEYRRQQQQRYAPPPPLLPHPESTLPPALTPLVLERPADPSRQPPPPLRALDRPPYPDEPDQRRQSDESRRRKSPQPPSLSHLLN